MAQLVQIVRLLPQERLIQVTKGNERYNPNDGLAYHHQSPLAAQEARKVDMKGEPQILAQPITITYPPRQPRLPAKES